MKKILYILIGILIFTSCTEIIDIELNSAMQRIVIEGKIDDSGNPAMVYLSRTTDYFNPDQPEKVSGAKVSISTDAGQVFDMVEMNTGEYQYAFSSLKSGQAYNLKIQDGDQVYEATSTLPYKVLIDSLQIQWFDSFNPNDSLGGGYILNCWFTDPAIYENFYMFTAKKLNKIYIEEPDFPGSSVKILVNDALFNGRPGITNLNRRGFYEAGDTVLVELIAIDQNTYNYLDQLGDVSGGGPSFGSSAPANPENNISNGAMGYFSAEAIDSKIVVIR